MFRVTPERMSEIASQYEVDGFVYLRYDADHLRSANAGADYGNSFTHENYIRTQWSKAGLEVVEVMPGAVRGWQDVAVLIKRSGGPQALK
jgi:hypothetical protein